MTASLLQGMIPHSLSGSPEMTRGMLWFIMCMLNGFGEMAGRPSGVLRTPPEGGGLLMMADVVAAGEGATLVCPPPLKLSTVAMLGSGDVF